MKKVFSPRHRPPITGHRQHHTTGSRPPPAAVEMVDIYAHDTKRRTTRPATGSRSHRPASIAGRATRAVPVIQCHRPKITGSSGNTTTQPPATGSTTPPAATTPAPHHTTSTGGRSPAPHPAAATSDTTAPPAPATPPAADHQQTHHTPAPQHRSIKDQTNAPAPAIKFTRESKRARAREGTAHAPATLTGSEAQKFGRCEIFLTTSPESGRKIRGGSKNRGFARRREAATFCRCQQNAFDQVASQLQVKCKSFASYRQVKKSSSHKGFRARRRFSTGANQVK